MSGRPLTAEEVRAKLTTPINDEKIAAFLGEQCVREQGRECRTLSCFINGGFDAYENDREKLNAIEPTCEAHELGKCWRAARDGR
jgi:hypothetical protein